MFSVQNVLIALKYCDYIPVISTVTNLVHLFVLNVFVPEDEEETHYYAYLHQEGAAALWLKCIPIIGNIYALMRNRQDEGFLSRDSRDAERVVGEKDAEKDAERVVGESSSDSESDGEIYEEVTVTVYETCSYEGKVIIVQEDFILHEYEGEID